MASRVTPSLELFPIFGAEHREVDPSTGSSSTFVLTTAFGGDDEDEEVLRGVVGEVLLSSMPGRDMLNCSPVLS